MKYLKDYREGDRVAGVYLCKYKQAAVTKNGKSYFNVVLQDKSGTMDAKVWDPNSAGIAEFDTMDYIELNGEVNSFQSMLQVSIKWARVCKEGEYDPADYLPCTEKNIEEMYAELTGMINKTKDPWLKQLLQEFFVNDEDFIRKFKMSSAAKAVHHGFVGGLLEHTVSVARMCEFYCTQYPMLKRDLLIAAALCHDMGKIREIAPFPVNDYTDDGNLLGHIVMGVEMVGEKIRNIKGFPPVLAGELKHCILAHHGEFEYGSPKKPAIMEAVALNFADNTDAKMETFTEILKNTDQTDWLGYNRLFESNVRMTRME